MKLFNKVLWQLCCIANGAKLLIVSIFLKSVLRVACETEIVRDYEIEIAGTSLIERHFPHEKADGIDYSPTEWLFV